MTNHISLTTYMKEHERELIQKAAKEEGLTASSYIKRLALIDAKTKLNNSTIQKQNDRAE